MGVTKRGLDPKREDSEIADEEMSDEEVDMSGDSTSDSEESSELSQQEEAKSDSEEEEEEVEEEEKDVVKIDEEDELVKAIKAAKEKVRNHPPDIQVEDCITDICFHPVKDFIGVALITGDAILYRYDNLNTEIVTNFELHGKACRDIEFSEDGILLFSSSKDKSVLVTDVETGKLRRFYDAAHEHPIYCMTVINENLFVTGDDDGIIRQWDIRQRSSNPIFSIKPTEEHICDMITNSAKKYLVCSSGDGAVTTINMHARKIMVQTEDYDSELTCLGLFRNESKILAGSSRGKMYIFNWGEFGLHSDEFTGVKQSLSCMVPVTENIAVVSGEDGVLRAIHLFPHKHVGIVGQHNMPVDKIDISNNGHYIASYSHNNDIKFWNSLYFEDIEVQTKKQNKRKDLKNNLPSSKAENTSDFFAGMS